MVNDNPQKQLQNGLPKGHPFVCIVTYNENRTHCRDLPLANPVGGNVHRTLTTINRCKCHKTDRFSTAIFATTATFVVRTTPLLPHISHVHPIRCQTRHGMPPPSPPPNIHRHHRRTVWHKTDFAVAEIAANFATGNLPLPPSPPTTTSPTQNTSHMYSTVD